MCTILIIEDDQRLASLLQTGIEEAGYHVLLAYDAEMALRIIKSEKDAIKLVISDIILPGMNGIELCKRIKEVMPCVPILMLTALGTTDDKAAQDGYGEANMTALRNTLLLIFLVSILLMVIVGYILATLTIRPIERALTSQKMFASNVSHELRTPLAAIMGELGLALQKERTPEDYQSRISRALDDASRMSDTIIGLLNLARAEYDASQIKMESIRVDELLMDVIEEMLRAKPEYHINLSFADPLLSPLKGEDGIQKSPFKGDLEGLEGPSVIANRYLLALAFRNLIENNCKYSSDHTSHIAIGVQQGLSITFADNGIGMNPAERRNLFRMFYRGSNHAEGGHGIGMALVQRIMVLHNASIDVQSKEGHGTKFIIKLNMKQH